VLFRSLRYVFHEVRVPLNSISMGLHLLQEELNLDPVTNASSLETLEMMKEASQFMSDTLNDVLSIQKIEEGKLEIVPKPFHLVDIVKTVSLSLKGQIDSKQLVYSTEIAQNCPAVVVGDRSRIEHVLANLLSNAIKFSASGSKLLVKVTFGEYKENCVTVAVHDEGVGISQENLKKLFRNYMQIDPDKQQGGCGTGIGLVICKEIIEMHKGEIGCTSKLRTGDDFTSGGSVFYFTVPFPVVPKTNTSEENSSTSKSSSTSAGATTEEPKSDEQHQKSSQHSQSDKKTSSSDGLLGEESFAKVEHPISKFPMNKFVVLIVDDVASNRKILRALLLKKGIDCDMVEDGQKCLDIVAAKTNDHYDIVFMDSIMPVMNGITATMALRKLGFRNKIAGLTGNAMDDDIQKFIDAGADLVFSKPLPISLLNEFLLDCEINGTGRSASC